MTCVRLDSFSCSQPLNQIDLSYQGNGEAVLCETFELAPLEGNVTFIYTFKRL